MANHGVLDARHMMLLINFGSTHQIGRPPGTSQGAIVGTK